MPVYDLFPILCVFSHFVVQCCSNKQHALSSAQNIFHSKLTAVNFFQGVYNYV